MAPHAVQVQARTLSGLGPSFTPHAEHTRDVGSNRPAFPKVRPCLRALYSSIPVNADQPASWTDLASRVRPSPATHSYLCSIPRHLDRTQEIMRAMCRNPDANWPSSTARRTACACW
jgi:hypothetical protein